MHSKQDMNERELLTDLLHTEKDMAKTYAGSITESASDELRRLLTRHMSECAEDQLCVFREMQSRGLYPTKQAQQQEISTAKQNMQDLQNETW
ncbi:MAG: spore coat protein [Clostridia bacterium]|nr:spore coat protein [Clostridia bacterium]MBQ2518141.1 spore coat protein [Clostridia bacterium]MBQ4341276.1 spore coat protein [Clostridia bacterium]